MRLLACLVAVGLAAEPSILRFKSTEHTCNMQLSGTEAKVSCSRGEILF